jgi:hypothetical protein
MPTDAQPKPATSTSYALDPGMPSEMQSEVLAALTTENDPNKLVALAQKIQAQYPIAAGLLMKKANPLLFKVAPHIVEDLGLNLYTSLPRVLVEFVANAYDADSPHAMISYDKGEIENARKILKKEYELEVVRNDKDGLATASLAARVLPENVSIVISDAGIGMSRDDLAKKFLIAGRRRRLEEPDKSKSCRSAKGRLLMGRKGLGKLAGFGVGKRVTVTTRKEGDAHATRIVLDYDQLVANHDTSEIPVPEEKLADGGGLAKSGTIVMLSRLLYDPLKSRDQTIENEIADHFALIDPSDFAIKVNSSTVSPAPRTHAYAWPQPDLKIDEYVTKTLEREGGGTISFGCGSSPARTIHSRIDHLTRRSRDFGCGRGAGTVASS